MKQKSSVITLPLKHRSLGPTCWITLCPCYASVRMN